MKLLSRIISMEFILLIIGVSCNNDYSKNPNLILGQWKSLCGKADLTIAKDSLEYYVIVYHKINSGEECPIRYPLIREGNSFYIKANNRILMDYSRKSNTLFLSPGGEYYCFQSQ